MKFLRVVSVICALMMAFSLVSCGSEPTDAPAGMIRASAETSEYDLFVPQGWSVTDMGNGASAYKSAQDPTSVSVISRHDSVSLAEWWEGYKAEFETVYADFAVETDGEDVLLGGKTAKKYVYTGTLGEVSYRYTQYVAYHNSALFMLTFTERADGGVDHAEEFSQIVDSFSWR